MSARQRARSAVARLPGARPAYGLLLRHVPGWRRSALRSVGTWQEAGWRPRVGRAAAEGAVGARLDALQARVAPGADLPPWRSRRGGAGALVAWWLSSGREDAAWLVLATLTGHLPLEPEVRALHRETATDGADVAAGRLLDRVRAWAARPGPELPAVELVDGVLVDVTTTTATSYTTGIQRVARETVDRWLSAHPGLRLVRWADDGRRLVEVDRSSWLDRAPTDGRPGTSVVPVRSTMLVPELAVGEDRTSRCAALAALGGSTVAVIGFDCVPVTTAETTALAMGGAFTGALTATREAARVAAISEAAAVEYRGWCRTVRASRPAAPRVRSVCLPGVAPAADPLGPARWQEVRDSVPGSATSADRAPLVLAVGSHEPRKNHEGLLHAAERLWQAGSRFDLVFVGGNAWHDAPFLARLRDLADRGRPVTTVSALPDGALAAAYADAEVTAFLSFNEGFGLPVTESLAVGTPVLTSDHGAMAELAADGGVLTVDPRDDDAVTAALHRLLTDRALREELSRQALARPPRTWDDYARECWAWLVEGQPA